jgi:hypothetical protein
MRPNSASKRKICSSYAVRRPAFIDVDRTGCQHFFASAVVVRIQGDADRSRKWRILEGKTVGRIRTKMYSALMGTLLAFGLVTAFSSPAAAAQDLYWKIGTGVSHSTVFSGSTSNNIRCYTAGGYYSTMCIRFDRRTIYVRSDRANGNFKLGQFAGGSSSNIYRCQNNKANSSGNGTWVKCQWNWPRSGCYILRTGHGQADWYTLSRESTQYCY